MKGHPDPAGFTLVELLIAMAIMLAVAAAVFSLANPAGEHVVAQPEVHDLQQRLRVAVDTLRRELLMAGAGMDSGSSAGSLVRFVAPVRPYRSGEIGADPAAGVFYRSDTISLMYVPPTVAQAQVESLVPAGAGLLVVRARPNCGPLGRDRLCGFRVDTPVLLLDGSGRIERGTVRNVEGLEIHLEGSGLRGVVDPLEGAAIAEVVSAVYSPGVDVATGTPRLMRYDGRRSNQPVVDHVLSVRFDYFGEPVPPTLLPGARLDGAGPWTTYGPRPPPVLRDRPGDLWGEGENCVFALVEGVHMPRLASLDPAGDLVALDPGILSDGPWCPDANDPERFDADLLRVRRVQVTVRLEAGPAGLRGRAAGLFTRPGTSTSPRSWVPDQEIRFDVAPRNLSLQP